MLLYLIGIADEDNNFQPVGKEEYLEEEQKMHIR